MPWTLGSDEEADAYLRTAVRAIRATDRSAVTKLRISSPANGGGIITAASNASGWFNRALIHPDLNDFAPRVGFAYQLMPRLVVRGGYGVFYQHGDRIGSESLIQLNPPQFIDTQLGGGASNPVFKLNEWVPFCRNRLRSSSA